ncbi:MAG: membrane protease YdiL (CAAX protease family) [Verrucomicrobiales bacterium]|jgi:membrane protease YdiL (CAAX protease family)
MGDYITELGVSPEIGRWSIGDGTTEAYVKRWVTLISEIVWSLQRVIGILVVIALTLAARWPWEFSTPGIRRRPMWIVVACGFGICVALVSGAHGMHYLLYGKFIYLGQFTEEHRILLYGNFSTWVKFYSALVLAPIAEEIFFRGWLQRLLTPICKVWPALLIQALVFGAFHYSHQGFNGFLMTGGMGLLIGLIFLYSGKLWPCILCHSLVNLFGSWGDIWWIMAGRPE